MPRERIHSQHHQPTPGGAKPVQPTFSADVAWSRDGGYVQVATTCSDGTERIVGIVNSWLENAGMSPIDLGELRAKLGDTPPYFDGWHATLETRADVNHMIRVLRRARDGAYGRDE